MPPEGEDAALAAAALCGTLGTWSERPGVVRAYFAEGAADVEAAFAAAWRAVADGPPPAVTARRVPAVDWLARWRESARPIEAAPGLWVAPPGAELPSAAHDPGAAALVILPGQGFGTGTHPTTRALLAWLVREPTRDAVLDVGTGSGILALAALARGARLAVALEIDEAAVDNAAGNRALNAAGWGGVPAERRMALVRGSLDALRPGVRFARVLANLDRITLELVVPDLAARVAPGGRLGVAGVLAGEEAGVLSRAREAGLQAIDQRVDPDPTANGAWWSGWLERAILIPS